MVSGAALATAAEGKDPATGLAAVAALRRLAEELEALHVDRARAAGWSWQEIADALGVTRQTVHKKHHVRRGLRRGR
jgi:DNA-directed RNA polymerase specialized sigma24 family protein